MKLTSNILNFKQFYLVGTGGSITCIPLSLADSIPLLNCIVLFSGLEQEEETLKLRYFL